MKKIAQAKREKKKDKLASKKNHISKGKPKMTKINGKNKKK